MCRNVGLASGESRITVIQGDSPVRADHLPGQVVFGVEAGIGQQPFDLCVDVIKCRQQNLHVALEVPLELALEQLGHFSNGPARDLLVLGSQLCEGRGELRAVFLEDLAEPLLGQWRGLLDGFVELIHGMVFELFPDCRHPIDRQLVELAGHLVAILFDERVDSPAKCRDSLVFHEDLELRNGQTRFEQLLDLAEAPVEPPAHGNQQQAADAEGQVGPGANFAGKPVNHFARIEPGLGLFEIRTFRRVGWCCGVFIAHGELSRYEATVL